METVIVNRMDVSFLDRPKEGVSDNGREGIMIILLNDDDTVMDYVTSILQTVFSMNHNESHETMMMAHSSGSALVGFYSEKKSLELLRMVDLRNSQTGNHLRFLSVEL